MFVAVNLQTILLKFKLQQPLLGKIPATLSTVCTKYRIYSFLKPRALLSVTLKSLLLTMFELLGKMDK
jgi:hypothetical protein